MNARRLRDLFRSSCIAKFYLDEPESEAVRRLAESLGQVRCVVVGQVEVAAVFHRKFRDDCSQGLLTWLPLTTALAAKTTAAFASAAAGVPAGGRCVALDRAQEHGLPEIYTNDRHISSAAQHFRLKPMAVASR